MGPGDVAPSEPPFIRHWCLRISSIPSFIVFGTSYSTRNTKKGFYENVYNCRFTPSTGEPSGYVRYYYNSNIGGSHKNNNFP